MSVLLKHKRCNQAVPVHNVLHIATVFSTCAAFAIVTNGRCSCHKLMTAKFRKPFVYSRANINQAQSFAVQRPQQPWHVSGWWLRVIPLKALPTSKCVVCCGQMTPCTVVQAQRRQPEYMSRLLVWSAALPAGLSLQLSCLLYCWAQATGLIRWPQVTDWRRKVHPPNGNWMNFWNQSHRSWACQLIVFPFEFPTTLAICSSVFAVVVVVGHVHVRLLFSWIQITGNCSRQ